VWRATVVFGSDVMDSQYQLGGLPSAGMTVQRATLRKTIKLSVLTANKMLPLGIDWYFHHVSF
jgi:hypothetical protein